MVPHMYISNLWWNIWHKWEIEKISEFYVKSHLLNNIKIWLHKFIHFYMKILYDSLYYSYTSLTQPDKVSKYITNKSGNQ